ncbi:MAG: hypothetical protein ACMXYB_02025 [Candidatus Woesearchaeota archaeon]
MNYNTLHIFLIFFKKFILYLLLMSFIMLNILDFFNFFSLITPYTGDVDFFKKLLSWSLIYYLFTSLSLTKILTGFKNKVYDWIILGSASLVVFPSILIFYLANIDFELYFLFSFMINELLLNFLIEYQILFVSLGVIILFIISNYIFIKQPIHKESLIGSFNLRIENYFSQVNKLLIILGFIFFFVYTVFKFFMEWFALAIDAALIVIGIGYYLYIYIFRHDRELKIDSFLQDIINTGNDFFKQLILFLQNKKTFFITIALLITVHLLVDLGVYLIPFATGIDNGLYNILGGENDLKPLFAVENSIIENQYKEIFKNSHLEIFPSIFLFLIISIELIMFIIYLVLFFIFLSMPFYILFLNLKGSIYTPSKKMIIFMITMVIVQFFLFFTNHLSNPIEFSISTSEQMQGVVFKTQSFTQDISSIIPLELVTSIIGLFILVLFIIIMLYKKFEKYKSFWISVYYVIILVFFLFYSTVFAQSYITQLYHSSVNEQMLSYNLELDRNSHSYLEVIEFLSSNSIQGLSLRDELRSIEGLHLEATLYLVSSGTYVIENQRDSLRFGDSDFIGFLLIVDPGYEKFFKDTFTFSTLSLDIDGLDLYVYDYLTVFQREEFSNEIYFIFEIDTSKHTLSNYVDLSHTDPRITQQTSNNILGIYSFPTIVEQVSKIASLIVFIFTSLFYVGGLIAYAVYYRRILERLKQKLF